jgi:serine/threonine-protein phosphatase 2A activator
MNIRELRHINISDVSKLDPPRTRIRTDDDVKHWTTTRSYHDYAIFLRRLNEAVVGHYLPWEHSNYSKVSWKSHYLRKFS